jgi:GNAT superfamily N-acetyltransferase
VNYDGEQAACFVAEKQSEVIAACWYWFGETYQRRNFWPLRPEEAKLVQITSAVMARGRGVAAALIRFSTEQMLEAGFNALYARVWHSHAASLRAFENAGWREHAKVLEASPLGRRTRVVLWT